MAGKRNILQLVAVLALLVTVLVSCEAIKTSETDAINVTYVYNNGEENKTEQIYRFAFGKPDDPKRDGYNFVGWCADAKLENFYSFDNAPESDIILYAKWELDYDKLLKDVSKEASLFNVKIKAKDHSLFASNVSQGSGVIYKNQNGVYYVLTNYHVLEGNTSTHKLYYVYDVYGNEYQAVKAAADPAYDLAVLCFEENPNVALACAKIEAEIPSNKETLICLSAPGGRFNTVTFGKAVKYESVTIDNESGTSDIAFDVLWLDCYAEHGSSGGAILDTDFNIVGIAYAVASDKFGNFKYSLAIPAEKVMEFLTAYGVF